MRTNQLFRYIRLLAVTGIVLAFSATARSQPINLLSHKLSYWQNDARVVSQIRTTTDSIYVVSRRGNLNPNTIDGYYMNFPNLISPDQGIGMRMGSAATFGDTGQPGPRDAVGLADHPFFAVVDGKAIFPQSPDDLVFRYAKLDGATGKTEYASDEIEGTSPFATWSGSGGNICFVRKARYSSGYEVGRLQTATSDGTEITTFISFMRPEATAIPAVGPTRLLGDVLLFFIYEDAGKTASLYRTDGTATGTQLLYTLTSPSTKKVEMVRALGQCFFGVNGSDGVTPFFVTDGTLTGTRTLSLDLPVSFDMSQGGARTESSTDFFWVKQQTGSTIHASDGVTTRVLPNLPDSQAIPAELAWVNDSLYISGFNQANSTMVLYVSDGYSVPVAVPPGLPFADIGAAFPTPAGTYLSTTSGIFRINGPLASAILVAKTSPYARFSSGQLPLFNGNPVFNLLSFDQNQTENIFIANSQNSNAPIRLTRFNNIPLSINPTNFIKAGNRLFFTEGLPQTQSTRASYRIDNPYTAMKIQAPNAEWLGVTPNGPLFYSDYSHWEDGRYYGDGKVYITSGNSTSAPPTEIVQSSPAHAPKRPTKLFELGDYCYFGGATGDDYPVLYKSNGTVAGTEDIPATALVTSSYPLRLIGASGSWGLFYAPDSNPSPPNYRVITTDGTAAGTSEILQSSTPPTEGAALPDGRIVFGATGTGTGEEIMISDGTPQGTSLLADIVPGITGSSPSHFTSAGNRVYFFASDSSTTTSLWMTDGTVAGTTQVSSIMPAFINGDGLDLLQSQHGGVYYMGVSLSGLNPSQYKYHLNYSNGTVPGTRNVFQGPLSSEPQLLAEVNGFMYLASTTASLGRELYRTVGYAGGINLIQDFAPGAKSGATMNEAGVLGNRLFFSADSHSAEPLGQEVYYIEVLDSKVNDWTLY